MACAGDGGIFIIFLICIIILSGGNILMITEK